MHTQGGKLTQPGGALIDPESGLAVMVVAVSPGSPAERAGLKPYDIIVTFGNRYARTTKDVHNMLGLEASLVSVYMAWHVTRTQIIAGLGFAQ